MKVFVCAMYDCIDGEMKLEKISAETDVEALCKILELDPNNLPEGVTADAEGLMQYAANGDFPAAVIEV